MIVSSKFMNVYEFNINVDQHPNYSGDPYMNTTIFDKYCPAKGIRQLITKIHNVLMNDYNLSFNDYRLVINCTSLPQTRTITEYDLTNFNHLIKSVSVQVLKNMSPNPMIAGYFASIDNTEGIIAIPV